MTPLKRFYRDVAVTDHDAGHVLALDAKPVNTPAGQRLIIPSRPLADAIADEWAAQGEHLLPHTMPLMQLMATSLDRVGPAREAAVDQLVRYGETDVLCYRAAEPTDLAERQAAMWQPLVEWAHVRYGARLEVVVGLMPQPQPPDALAALRAAVADLDALRLTGLLAAAGPAGSLILALALDERRIAAEEAWALSLLDETYQIERWGEDEEARIRRATTRDDLIAAERFLALVPRG
jgi:chaperone required for assembly of F1-ATPase